MWRLAFETGAVGLEIAAAIAIGYFGGQYLDSKFHSTPWLKWIGFGAGIGAAIKALIRVTRNYTRTTANEDDHQ
jgi:F0F1-type ATP synthase assembly protein I